MMMTSLIVKEETSSLKEVAITVRLAATIDSQATRLNLKEEEQNQLAPSQNHKLQEQIDQ
jgi:hypothetical protein